MVEQPTMTPLDPREKPRVAFVTNVGYSLFRESIVETYGGAQIDLYLLAKELLKRGTYDVAMVFLDYGQAAAERIEGVLVVKSFPPRHGGWILGQFFTACVRLWQALDRADADIYFHEGAEFEIAITRIFCLVKKRKYIFRCANIIDVDGRYHRSNPLHGMLFSFGLSGAHAIVAQTKDQQALLERSGRASRVVENMYPEGGASAGPNGAVLWVGRMTKVKRPDIFVRLAEKFPNQDFLMVGPTDTLDQEYAKKIRVRLKSVPNLRYIEKVPFRETQKIFDHSSVLVNTSVYEGFPMTMVQAMSTGIPILSLGIDPDYIVSRHAGLVAQEEQTLPEKLNELLDQEHWKHYSVNARRYATEHFSPSVIVPRYETIFHSVLTI